LLFRKLQGVQLELSLLGIRRPFDIERRLIHGIAAFFFLGIGRHGQANVLINLEHLRRGDAHEENEQHQQHIDHRSDLKLRLAVFCISAASSHGCVRLSLKKELGPGAKINPP